MNPLTLHVRNYRCFSELDLELPDGCVAILGENGVGKSAIVEAIEVALFGTCRTGRLPAQLARGTDADLVIEFEFEHAGADYRVRRTYSCRGRGKSSCDLEQQVDGEWLPLTAASIRDTDDLIARTLGLTHATFCASSFLAQGSGGKDFTEADPAARKKVLTQVLGLDRYDHLQERARQDRRTIEAEQQTLDGRSQAARELAEQKPQVVRDRDAVVEAETLLTGQTADLEHEHAALVESYQQAREQASRRLAAEAELREATAEQVRLDDLARRGDEATAIIATAREELATLVTADNLAGLEEQLEQFRSKQAAYRDRQNALAEAKRERDRCEDLRARAAEAAAELRKRAEQLRAEAEQKHADPDALCQACGQHISDAAKERALGQLLTLASECTEHATANDAIAAEQQAFVQEGDALLAAAERDPVEAPDEQQLRDLDAGIARARAGVEQRARLEERIRQASAVIDAQPADLASLKADAAAAVAAKSRGLDLLQPVDLDGITRAGQLVKQRLETARASLGEQRTLRARLDERLAQITEAERSLVEAAADSKRLHAALDVAVLLERAFGRDGIPALIVENAAIPYLEAEANRIVGELGTSYRVELRTQAELKSGEGLRDTLDVVVETENGERAYETFSGGERTRINLALRIALARLLAHRRGAESRLLVIDEPDGLDEAGMAALVDVLRGLETDFSKLYVVSHVPALRDSFDTTLSVIGGGDGWSRIDETEVFEAVVA